jgi:hypothetical protein
MIKATEARIITKSVGLDRYVLDKIQNAIIATANKGGYTTDISSLKVGQPYIDYLEELGYTITHYKNKSIGIYVEWIKKIKI